MSFDPVDSNAVMETANAMRGFDMNMAEAARFDDQTYSSNTIIESMDYQLSSDSNNALDFAYTGTNWDPNKNILAAYFDGTGAIVNGYY
ncbi:MAG: hypothetical protein PHX58_13080 [Desulfovibrio sp.]|nr:hypothetical protein [Desulfovibrio sp.]